jgi:hypothetical protein
MDRRLDRVIGLIAGVFGVALPLFAWMTGLWWLLSLSIAASAICLVLAICLYVRKRIMSQPEI